MKKNTVFYYPHDEKWTIFENASNLLFQKCSKKLKGTCRLSKRETLLFRCPEDEGYNRPKKWKFEKKKGEKKGLFIFARE